MNAPASEGAVVVALRRGVDLALAALVLGVAHAKLRCLHAARGATRQHLLSRKRRASSTSGSGIICTSYGPSCCVTRDRQRKKVTSPRAASSGSGMSEGRRLASGPKVARNHGGGGAPALRWKQYCEICSGKAPY
eukprot:scaffold133845_cov33-Tisochrysis_lutea.AAC.2